MTKNNIVNFVSDDPVLQEKIRFYSGRQQRLSFIITENPIQPPAPVDLYVLSLRLVQSHQLSDMLIHKRTPFIVYGPAERLKSAFLLGCADYLKEPWSPVELGIRVKKQLGDAAVTFSWGSVSYVPTILQSDYGRAELTYHEYRIFALLAREQGNIVPREAFFYELPGKQIPGSRAIDMHIANMRKKTAQILPKNAPHIIRSARNIGYFIPG